MLFIPRKHVVSAYEPNAEEQAAVRALIVQPRAAADRDET